MTELQKAEKLVGVKAFPAISILLPVQTIDAGLSQFRERLSLMLRNVEGELSSRYSKLKTAGLMSRLHRMVNGIDLTETGKSIAIYISEKTEKIFNLPFAVAEKTVIDDSFEIRDLLYAAKLNRTYLLVVVSRNNVQTMMGYGKSLVMVDMEGMPDNLEDVSNEHSFPGWDYLDTKAYEESNIEKFIRFIDDTISQELKNNTIPVIFLGDTKLLGHYRKKTKLSRHIVEYIDGNYEHLGKRELLDIIDPVLGHLILKEEKQHLAELEQANSRNQVSSGIAQVWRTAAEARGRLLFVEKDYREEARLGSDGYTLVIDSEVSHARNRIEDAVDDIIEMVLKNKGDIVFVSNGSLDKYERIAMINRY